jgi:hypothetical protein
MMLITLTQPAIRMDIEGANTGIYRRLRIPSNFWRSKALLPLHGFQGFCFRRRRCKGKPSAPPQVPHPLYLQIPEFKWHIFEDDVPIDVADSGIMITPFEGRTACYLTEFLRLGSDTECSAAWTHMVNECAPCVCPYASHIAIDANAALYAEK